MFKKKNHIEKHYKNTNVIFFFFFRGDVREFCETCLLGQINPSDDGGVVMAEVIVTFQMSL